MRSGGVKERGERGRHRRRKTEGEEKDEKGINRGKHWGLSTPRLPQSLRQSYCSSPMPDWGDGMDHTVEQGEDDSCVAVHVHVCIHRQVYYMYKDACIAYTM